MHLNAKSPSLFTPTNELQEWHSNGPNLVRQDILASADGRSQTFHPNEE